MDFTHDDDIEFESNDFGYDPNLSCSGVNSGQGQEFQLMRTTFLPRAKGKCENAHLKTISWQCFTDICLLCKLWLWQIYILSFYFPEFFDFGSEVSTNDAEATDSNSESDSNDSDSQNDYYDDDSNESEINLGNSDQFIEDSESNEENGQDIDEEKLWENKERTCLTKGLQVYWQASGCKKGKFF